MPGITSIHEYELKADVRGSEFEAAVRDAQAGGLLDLPGLASFQLVCGIRGERYKKYAAIWGLPCHRVVDHQGI